MRDLKFWEAFLDMMAENRFNVISLWNLNPYTYLVRPANFPEASPWSEAEFTQWQHLYREIFRLAKERGLDTYLVPWNIFVSRPFAEAHGVARENVYPHYYVDGDTSELVRRYLRESVTQVLNEYPDLDGFGISLGNVGINMLLQSLTPGPLRGRVVSFFTSARFGFDAIGGLVAGMLATLVGASNTLLVEGVLLAAFLLVLLKHVARLRKEVSASDNICR